MIGYLCWHRPYHIAVSIELQKDAQIKCDVHQLYLANVIRQ